MLSASQTRAVTQPVTASMVIKTNRTISAPSDTGAFIVNRNVDVFLIPRKHTMSILCFPSVSLRETQSMKTFPVSAVRRFDTVRVPDLPQHDDAFLRAPVGDDVKHPGPVAPDDPVVHLRVLPNVSIHGPDRSHLRPKLPGLLDSELIESCGETPTLLRGLKLTRVKVALC